MKKYTSKEKIKMLCKENNIADINEFTAFYLQYKNYYSVTNLVKAYQENVFLTNEFKY